MSLDVQLDRAVASGNLNWIAYVTKRMAEVQAQECPKGAPRPRLDLAEARRYIAQLPAPEPEPEVVRRLILVKPTHRSPKEDRAPKHVTERPYLERNKRYSPFSLR
ncbi:hypothetical protein ACSSVY_001997 [Roseovarius sp. MBR-51]